MHSKGEGGEVGKVWEERWSSITNLRRRGPSKIVRNSIQLLKSNGTECNEVDLPQWDQGGQTVQPPSCMSTSFEPQLVKM